MRSERKRNRQKEQVGWKERGEEKKKRIEKVALELHLS